MNSYMTSTGGTSYPLLPISVTSKHSKIQISPRQHNKVNNKFSNNGDQSPIRISANSSSNDTMILQPCRKFFNRIILTLLICPSYFFSAFLWEFAALYNIKLLHLTSYDAIYFLLTGTSAALGIFIARVVVMNQLHLSKECYLFELHSTIQSSLASGIAAGSLWQYSVNLSIKYEFSFTEAFIFVFTMSTVCYFMTTVAIRLLNTKLPVSYQLNFRPMSFTIIYYDFLESLTVGIADAFFVSTDSKQFNGSWLLYFNVNPNVTNTFFALCLAGSSASMGFLLLQTVFNLCLSDNWIDYLFVQNTKLVKAGVHDT